MKKILTDPGTINSIAIHTYDGDWQPEEALEYSGVCTGDFAIRELDMHPFVFENDRWDFLLAPQRVELFKALDRLDERRLYAGMRERYGDQANLDYVFKDN